jgi:putative NIF3 family GTP cyclohydrolase 1 type 2
MHTNLDAACGGVNDALAAAVEIVENSEKTKPLPNAARLAGGEVISLGRVGYLEKACPMPVYLEKLKTRLKTNGIRYFDAGRPVYKVAIASGSGNSQWENAIESGCDTFVSAELKYHTFLEAKELGINLIDAGHFCTENVITEVLVKKLSKEFPAAKVTESKTQDQTIEFYPNS